MPRSWKRIWKTKLGCNSLHSKIPAAERKWSLIAALYFIVPGNFEVSFQLKLPIVTNYVQFYEQWPLETDLIGFAFKSHSPWLFRTSCYSHDGNHKYGYL